MKMLEHAARRWPPFLPVLFRCIGVVFVFGALSGVRAGDAPQNNARIKTIYIMPSSHWDLGFVAPPEEILTRVKPHIDEVIANAKADPEFRWTIESAWQVHEWLSRTSDPAQIQEFVELVQKGQILLSASWGSMHTEFMGAEELNRIAYEMTAIEKQLGVHTDFAMMDDVPGFTLRLPQILDLRSIAVQARLEHAEQHHVRICIRGNRAHFYASTALVADRNADHRSAIHSRGLDLVRSLKVRIETPVRVDARIQR